MLTELVLDTGETLTAEVEANLQIPSAPPNLQCSHPRHMTRTEDATEKQRHKIFSALL